MARDLLPLGMKRISPVGVKSYLQDHAWLAIDSRQPLVALYKHGKSEVLLPLDPGFSDFEVRLAQLILQVAMVEDRPPEGVFQDLLFTHADVIRRRLVTSEAENGTIPLSEVTTFYDDWKRALAEIAVASVTGTTEGKSQVNDFLSSCKAGQTERGSFIGTVICPLNAKDPFGVNFQPPLGAELPLHLPFSRVVTTNFVTVLREATAAVESKEINRFLDSTEGSRMTPKFCEAIHSMVPRDKGSVDFCVGWSPIIAAPPILRKVISISSDLKYGYEQLASRLKPPSSGNRQEFIGKVEQLTAKTGDDLLVAGTIRLAFLHEGKARLAKIELGHLNYLDAIHAHERARNVFLTGILLRASRISTITEVDDFRIVQA